MFDQTRLNRLLEQVERTRNNCTFEDIERLLLACGFSMRSTASSHFFFKRGPLAISIPKKKPVKRRYVDEALELIRNM